MMTDHSGPAFPAPTETTFQGGVFKTSAPGMTLRQWLAGQALPMVMQTMPAAESLDAEPQAAAETIARVAARWSVLVADAVLAELAKS